MVLISDRSVENERPSLSVYKKASKIARTESLSLSLSLIRSLSNPRFSRIQSFCTNNSLRFSSFRLCKLHASSLISLLFIQFNFCTVFIWLNFYFFFVLCMKLKIGVKRSRLILCFRFEDSPWLPWAENWCFWYSNFWRRRSSKSRCTSNSPEPFFCSVFLMQILIFVFKVYLFFKLS
jgi:hypothetical protein